MDVHRSRFVAYPTPSITSLAFSRPHDLGLTSSKPEVRLAIGRSNGSIELWNPLDGSWAQETIFPPADEGAVDSLVWTQEPDERGADGEVIVGQHRLFSIGATPAVTEWNLQTGTVKKRSTGNFAEVWCLAAQPSLKPPRRAKEQEQEQELELGRAQDLVAGCGDGTLVLLSTEDNDLQFKRFLARVSGKRARCLTIAFQKPEVVVAGFADGMIRIFDTRNGAVIRNMSLGASVPGAPKTALVWKVTCLLNGDIVSADSNGQIKIWDGKSLSMSQRLQGHEGDCLDLVASYDGKTLFSSGVDGRIAHFQLHKGDQGRLSWSKISHRRIHHTQGPVKTLAAFDSKSISVVVSGGGDPAPIITPLREYGRENIRTLPFLPQRPSVISAPDARLVVSWWDKTIWIYRMARQNSLELLSDELHRVRKVVAKITLKTQESIRDVTISHRGHLLAASTNSEVKVFQLKRRSIEKDQLAVRKLELPDDLADSGARLLTFSRCARWLAAVTPDNEVQLVALDSQPRKPKMIRVLNRVIELERQQKSTKPTGFRDYEQSITRLAFNEHGSVLVASDLGGSLHSWALQGKYDSTQPAVAIKKDSKMADEGESDSESDSSDDDDEQDVVIYGQHWSGNSDSQLPRLDASPLILTFRPTTDSEHVKSSSDSRLVVITARHQVYEFNMPKGHLTEWSRKNPTAVLPFDFTKIRDRVMNGVWDGKGRLWLYGANFVCMLDVTQNFEANDGKGAQDKRKRSDDDGNERSKKKKSSGAGDSNGDIFGVTGSRAVQKAERGRAITDPTPSDRDDEDEDEDEEEALDLRLDRAGHERGQTGEDDDVGRRLVKGSAESKRWWCTFKYRPILGMVPLSGEDHETAEAEDALEVVLVERPPIVGNDKAMSH